MTADEIRAYKLEPTCDVATDQCAPMIAECAVMLREIAAQLAEVNEHLKRIAYPPMTVITQNRIAEAHIPKEK